MGDSPPDTSMSRKESISKQLIALQAEKTRLEEFGHGVSCSSGGACNLCKIKAGIAQLEAE